MGEGFYDQGHPDADGTYASVGPASFGEGLYDQDHPCPHPDVDKYVSVDLNRIANDYDL